MYEINIREFKRSLYLLNTLGSARHPDRCIQDETPIKITVDLMGNFFLETPSGMTFGTDVSLDEMTAPFTTTVAFKHLKVIKKLAFIKNKVEIEYDDDSHMVMFKVNEATTYRFREAVA